jgi:hypothetical protein
MLKEEEGRRKKEEEGRRRKKTLRPFGFAQAKKKKERKCNTISGFSN